MGFSLCPIKTNSIKLTFAISLLTTQYLGVKTKKKHIDHLVLFLETEQKGWVLTAW
jgi:hypothetical protein